ncbi:hypothetical protein Pyrfu_1457 [Pyrolobus fumarii 1A]|uniref:Uncharacterized protein n=1 Tax=Pyrolobus fumarii (strain DSM 11204 / 1A) TaxID=694429 RepID=G0EH91_PYRF1|nr:hypothetical protein [Pyrolobus fumarii]AEM39315.1 hypothetical protein Pyrfu_1457 [Pyrolobus fumarii 1A]
MKYRRTLASIYAFVSLTLYLYVYPLVSDELTSLAIAAAVGWAAAYTAYTVPRYSGIIFSLAAIAAMLSLASASPAHWLYIALSDFIVLLSYVMLTLALLAAGVSIRRYIGIIAASTGLLAGATLHAPYGHLAAIGLLAMYAALSGSVSRTLIALLFEEYTRFSLSMCIASMGIVKCFDGFTEVPTRPIKPLVDALLEPIGKMSPEVIQVLYKPLSFFVLTFAGAMLVYGVTAAVASSVERRLARWTPEAAAITKHSIILSSALSLLSYFTALNLFVTSSWLLSCNFRTPFIPTFIIAASIATTSILVKLLHYISSIRSLSEEKNSLIESIDALRQDVIRLLNESRTSRVTPRNTSEKLKALLEKLDNLKARVVKAGLLELPNLERLLTEFEAEYRDIGNSIVASLEHTLSAIHDSCRMLSRWASEHSLPKDCHEAPLDIRGRDAHRAIIEVERAAQKLLEYIELLLDEIEVEAEEAKIEAKELLELRKLVESIDFSDPETLRNQTREFILKASSILGRVYTRQA